MVTKKPFPLGAVSCGRMSDRRASSLVDGLSMRPHMGSMCGRVIQSSGPLRYGLVDGMDARDTRVHNYPPRWNAAPSQELL